MSELRIVLNELEQKRQFIIEELTKRNVTKVQGKELKKASYESLKEELVLQAFKEIDVECDSNKWF